MCRDGGPKNFLKQVPTGKSPGFPAGQSATGGVTKWGRGKGWIAPSKG